MPLLRPSLLRLIASLLLAGPCLSPAASAAEVVADDHSDTYAISGALLFDGRYGDARAAAGCSDCHWRITRICSWADIGARPGCILQAWECTAEESLAVILRADAPARPPDDDPRWQARGTTCLGPAPPQSATSIHSELHEHVTLAVPPLRAASQPQGTTLTRLSTYFRSGQPRLFAPATLTIAGVPVTLRAVPTWHWRFGDGSELVTSDPGGVHPDGAVTHAFRRRGLHRVTVVTTWSAEFDARGITAIPVSGDAVTQTQSFDLRVREGRTFLTKEHR